jgi:hypothetical protein
MAVKHLQLVVAVCAGLLFGTLIGYTTKPIPEPDVRVKALLSPPFVEVTVNGKAVDLGKIRLVPEQPDKKKKSGDVGEIGEVVRPAASWILFDQDPLHEHGPHMVNLISCVTQRDNRSVEAFGIETLAKVLLELKEAIFGNRDKGTPGLRDDIAKGLGDFYGTLRTGVIVAGGTLVGFMAWVGINVQRIADHSAKVA